MDNPKFILSKKILIQQVKKLQELGLNISYSYKTNHIVGDVLQEIDEGKDVSFSIHSPEEIRLIKDKNKIWFFLQAENEKEISDFLKEGINKFVVDNELDLKTLLNVINSQEKKISLSLRMKFQEHRVGTGKYFVYGLPCNKINELILKLKNEKFISKLGINFHRKSQNVSEWEIISELNDSLSPEVFEKIDFINLGGGLPALYISLNKNIFDYIFSKIKETKKFLMEKKIDLIIEPGRFLAAPCIKLFTSIIQKDNHNLIINTSVYNCALDTLLTGTKLLVENELNDDEEGDYFLIKGNSPTRDDIFRYKVRLNKNIQVGDKIIFINAGAYNYATDFFGYKKIQTEIKEDF